VISIIAVVDRRSKIAEQQRQLPAVAIGDNRLLAGTASELQLNIIWTQSYKKCVVDFAHSEKCSMLGNPDAYQLNRSLFQDRSNKLYLDRLVFPIYTLYSKLVFSLSKY
jgi:hypothetical protein